MQEVSKIQASQPAQTTQGTSPKFKTEEPVEIYKEMSVKTVEANGSEAQKIAAEMFDFNDDGKYDKHEAEFFNNMRFYYDPKDKIFRATNKKTGHQTIIKYDNIENLKKTGGFFFYSRTLKGGTSTLDIKNKTAVYEDVSGISVHVDGLSNVTIKNADLRYIMGGKFDGTLNADAVRHEGLLWDSPTKVVIGPDAAVKQNNSKLDIRLLHNEE